MNSVFRELLDEGRIDPTPVLECAGRKGYQFRSTITHTHTWFCVSTTLIKHGIRKRWRNSRNYILLWSRCEQKPAIPWEMLQGTNAGTLNAVSFAGLQGGLSTFHKACVTQAKFRNREWKLEYQPVRLCVDSPWVPPRVIAREQEPLRYSFPKNICVSERNASALGTTKTLSPRLWTKYRLRCSFAEKGSPCETHLSSLCNMRRSLSVLARRLSNPNANTDV